MHIDLSRTKLADFITDVCVIGAGAAGITLTRRLLAAGRTVTLLESGGLDYEAATADLNAGDVVGEPYYRLDHARMRFFGGTTAIWGGRVAELDPIDFQKRDWVPHSGWPFGLDELRPYYDEARAFFDLGSERMSADRVRRAGVPLPDFDEQELSIKLWGFDPRHNRFTFRSCKDVIQHPRCTVLTHATAISIEVNEHANAVERVQVQSLWGEELALDARVVVLAAGGIENPRLLLASRGVMQVGLGNQNDLVGRFFMEHPHSRGGRIETRRTWKLLKGFGQRHTVDGQKVAALITPSERRQATEKILNTSLTFAPRQPAEQVQFWGMRAYNRVKHDMAPTRGARALWLSTKRTVGGAQKFVDPLRPWLLHKIGQVELALLVRAEQAPNPNSRVLLGDDSDRMGVPRVRLDWRLTDLDIHSVERLVTILGDEVRRRGLGQIVASPWLSAKDRCWHTDPLVSAHPIGGYHHMGTTRMSDTDSQGVTDGYGKVHGLANLYIAGSSLFPTGGWANPTLTIVALALRTADRIARHGSSSDRPVGTRQQPLTSFQATAG
jgi:choline dehydrogenase-like flavoprotein